MFLLRLKTEFAENLKLMLALWITLGVIVWSFFDWWHGPLVEQGKQGALGSFALLAAGIILFYLIGTMFKRDDLKHPQDFWATRPIRAFTLFGTKLVFAWLVVVFPMGVLMTLLGIVAGIGPSAVWHGLEMMMWAGFFTSLLALSCMAFPGGGRSLFCTLAFFGGVILASVVMSRSSVDHLLGPYRLRGGQVAWNLLVILLLLNAWLLWRCVCLMYDKHQSRSPDKRDEDDGNHDRLSDI